MHYLKNYRRRRPLYLGLGGLFLVLSIILGKNWFLDMKNQNPKRIVVFMPSAPYSADPMEYDSFFHHVAFSPSATGVELSYCSTAKPFLHTRRSIMRHTFKDCAAILSVAIVTMAGTAFLLHPGAINAVDDGSEVEAEVAVASLNVKGCTLTMKADKEAYAVDEMPIITVVATNLLDEAVDVSVPLTIFSSSPSSRMSRMVARPVAIWQTDCQISLKAGETRILTYASETKLPAKKTFSLLMGKTRGAQVGEVVTRAIKMIPADAANVAVHDEQRNS